MLINNNNKQQQQVASVQFSSVTRVLRGPQSPQNACQRRGTKLADTGRKRIPASQKRMPAPWDATCRPPKSTDPGSGRRPEQGKITRFRPPKSTDPGAERRSEQPTIARFRPPKSTDPGAGRRTDQSKNTRFQPHNRPIRAQNGAPKKARAHVSDPQIDRSGRRTALRVARLPLPSQVLPSAN